MKKKNPRKESKSKYLWYVIAISSLVLFAVIMLSAVLNIGSKIRSLNESFGLYLEIGFYALMVLVLVFGIIRPIIIIVKSPSLAIITTVDDRSRKTISTYKKVAKVIVKNNELPLDQKVLLTSYHNPDELLFNISYVFQNTVRKQLNGIIIRNAKIVMISTAICQNGKFDMMTTFAVNVKMIKELVLKCGFRPSMKNLSKLTVNVFATALIADGLENLTLQDVMPKTALDTISEIPMLGKLIESFLDGCANAILTLRIGCVARRYLYSDGAIVTKEDIRRNAYKETVKLIPTVIWETASFFPKRIVKFFTRKKDDEEMNLEVVANGNE
ncbi:MAG: DUF697 domain-containing protein [Acholeplasmatales bacterium]|nr:DUF697 domain-containing protein [Acholeplasmatales bacterium]